MRKLKKAVVLAVLAVVMTMMVSVGAKAETLTWGKYYTVDIDSSTDNLYDMVLPTSGKVVITMNIEDSFYNNDLFIKDASGDEIFKDDWVKEGLKTYSHELLAGNYILGIHAVSMHGSFTVNYYPSGETVSESCFSKNNQLPTASTYVIGTTTKAHFALNDDKDIYKVKVNKAGYLTIKYSSNLTEFDMQMVSEDCETSYNEYNIPFGSSAYKYFVPKGTYYISFIRGGKEYTGTYTFSTNLSGLTKTKVKSAKNLSGKKAKITWTKKNDVDGYQVQVALNKKFTKGRKSKTLAVTTGWSAKNPTNHTFTKLKKGKYYYARVRTYKLVNGTKCYSDWSSAKKFKVKK